MDGRAAAGPEDAGPAPLHGSVTCTVASGSGGLPHLAMGPGSALPKYGCC